MISECVIRLAGAFHVQRLRLYNLTDALPNAYTGRSTGLTLCLAMCIKYAANDPTVAHPLTLLPCASSVSGGRLRCPL